MTLREFRYRWDSPVSLRKGISLPTDYHGGSKSGVQNEKLLEHWIASQILGLIDFRPGESYVDVAAAGSPWAKELRERKDINAYAIDLSEIDESYRRLPYYRVENATQTTFADADLNGISLQCAYEMFINDDDSLFIHEVARILRPGGKPLYCLFTCTRTTVPTHRQNTMVGGSPIQPQRNIFG